MVTEVSAETGHAGDESELGAAAELARLQRENGALKKALCCAEAVFHVARLGTWEWPDPTQDHAVWSDGFLEILGYGPGELTSSVAVFKELVHPDDLARTFEGLEERIASRRDFMTQYRLRCASGEYRWFESRTTYAYPDGESPAMVGSIQDIHERRAAEEALKALQVRHALSLRASRIGIWDWDVVHDELIWDDQMYGLYGMEAKNFSSAYDAWESSLHPEDRERAVQAVQRALSGEAPFDIEFRIMTPQGTIRRLHGIATVVRDEDGSPLRLVGVNSDVTERREIEERLRQSNADLEHFAYVASHDLKTPLRGISTALGWLLEDIEDGRLEEVSEHVKLMQGRVARLDSLVDGLLRYARADSAADMTTVDLDLIVDQVRRDVVANYDGFSLRVFGVLPRLRGNPVLLRQVLGNLVDNAIKHHDRPTGTITVTAAAPFGLPQISVRDDGPGIPPEFRERVFEVFQTLKSRDAGGGSGIGLSLVRKIIERHGGSITVEGNAPRGSCFTFTWPQVGEEAEDEVLGADPDSVCG